MLSNWLLILFMGEIDQQKTSIYVSVKKIITCTIE